MVPSSIALRDAACPVVETLEGRQLMCVDVGFSASVNFTTSSAGVIDGYTTDTGNAFADYDSGLSFGWSSTNTASARLRANNPAPSKLHASFNQIKAGQKNLSWEMAVPTGDYEVRIVSGDASKASDASSLIVEGQKFDGAAIGRWHDGIVSVHVSDGRLTITGDPKKTSKIDFVEIKEVVHNYVGVSVVQNATESGDTGQFLVSRAGLTDDAVDVHYTVSGSAQAGTDYNALSGVVTIPAGSFTQTIDVHAIADSLGESPESLTIQIVDGSDYDLGNPSNATMQISDTALKISPAAAQLAVLPAAAAPVLAGADIGGAKPNGSTSTDMGSGDYDVVAGGLQIDKNADSFHFSYVQRTGDFDVKVQVTSLTQVDTASKAGLMAREGLGAGSRDIFAGITAAEGFRYGVRTSTDGTFANSFKGGTSDFGHAYVRLSRSGNVFTGYMSTDGVTWTQTGQTTMNLPSTIYVGLATNSKSATKTVTAKYRGFGETTAATPTAPNMPTGLTAQAASQTEIDLAWNSSSGATLYRIQRKGPSDSNFVDYTSTSLTTFADKNLTAGLYEYKIDAENLAGASTYTASVSADSSTWTPPVNGSLTSANIGGSPSGSSTMLTDGVAYDVVGGGMNIGKTTDAFRYVYKQITGDFDMRVQVSALTDTGDTPKAGLMARDGLGVDAKNIFVGATAAKSNFRLSSRTKTGGDTTTVKTGTVSYPNAWVRLKRVGDVFTAYYSTAGSSWTKIGTVTVSLSNTLYFGLAATSGAAGESTTAQFRNLSLTSAGGTTTPTPTPTPTPTGTATQMFKWDTLAPAGQAVFEAGGVEMNGKLYVFGGYYNHDLQASNKAYAYDPTTNVWTRIADMPENRHHVAWVADEQTKTIYGIGGYIGDSPGVTTATVIKYDVQNNKWSYGVALPQVRGAGTAVLVGRELHYFGGTSAKRYETNQAEHYVLNLDNTSAGWTTKANLLTARNHITSAVVDGKIYAIGGMDKDNGLSGQFKNVEVYDPATDKWTEKADLPYGLSHAHAVVNNGRIYIAGGQINGGRSGIQTDKSVMYDPATDTWIALQPLASARKSPVAGFIGDKLYEATGNAGDSTPTNNLWGATYINHWETEASLPTAMTEVRGAVIGNKIYVVGEGSSHTYAYNLSTNSWADVGADRPYLGLATDAEHAVETLDGKLYLFGGLGNGAENKVQIYDPKTNKWTLGKNQPFDAGDQNSAMINGKFYVAGGALVEPTYHAVANSAVYDPASNTWTNLPDMPLPRHAAASATDGQKLWVFGGRDKGLEDSSGTNTVQYYDPSTNKWTTSNDANGPARVPRNLRGQVKAVYYKGEFWIFGGETSFGSDPGATSNLVFKEVDIYNPTTNTWRRGPDMPTARHALLAIQIGGRIYTIGGGVKHGESRSTTVEVLNAG